MGPTRISEKFRQAARISQVPLYRLALQCDIPPGRIYKVIRGIAPVHDGDQRIIALGRLLGLSPAECFFSKKDSEGEATG